MALSACTAATQMPTTPVGSTGGGPVPAELAQVVGELAAVVQQLAQVIGAMGIGAAPVSAPAADAMAGQVATAAGAPVGAAAAPSAAPASASAPAPASAGNAPSGPRGANDGPGVHRRLVSKQELERDPKLRGKLDPPRGGRPPEGVRVRTNADGARVVTINIHGSTPAGKGITPRNESIAGLRDIAAYVNSIDADVVMLQEVKDRPFDPKDPGVSAVTSVLYHLMEGSDMAMTPGRGANRDRKGTAMITRNGFTIDRAVNVDIPDAGDTARRSAGVAVIQPPGGQPAFTAVNTHLSHMPSQAASDRRHAQLVELNRIVSAIANGGSFTYQVPEGGRHSATGFPGERIVLGGDLNTTRRGRNGNDSADGELRGSGLRHANQVAGRNDARAGIDHLYVAGWGVGGTGSMQIGAHELGGGRPTDHPAVYADLR